MKKICTFLIIGLLLFSMFLSSYITENADAIGQHETNDGLTYGSILNGTDPDLLMLTLRPDGNGDLGQLSRTGDTANYKCVDEVIRDNHTTYVSHDQPTWETDLYNMADPSLSDGIFTKIIVHAWCGIVDDSGKRRISIKTGGNIYQQPEGWIGSSANYNHESYEWTLNPQTEVAWTLNDINSLQCGISLYNTGPNGIHESRCTQLYVDIYYHHKINVTRTTGSVSESNVVGFIPQVNYTTGNVTLKIPVSTDVQGILDVTNNTNNILATEVNNTNELINNTFWYDSANQFVYIRTTDLTIPQTVNWTINCSYGATFYLIIPSYLEVGQYFHSEGFITDENDNAISGLTAETRVLYQNGTAALEVNPKWNCTNGNYRCVFSTCTLIPGIYAISIEFTDPISGVIFKEGSTLYLSTTPGDEIHVVSNLHFTFYNNNTGMGLNPELFKIYASEDVTVDSSDRIYVDDYTTYTGQTIYYRVNDYFDNQIYPRSGTYQTLSITDVEQFEDIPIDWYSFSVKNMNHSIVHFNMISGNRTYSQYLYPYEPFYWNVLNGTYTINLTYYNTETDAIEDYFQENITITDDTYYWIRGYDLQDIIIEITNTNTTIMDQIVNVGVYISNAGSEVINQTINLASYLSNTESNITNQMNLVWNSVNNTQTTVINQVNSVWSTVNNTETTVINQANSVRQSITNTETNITGQLNSVWQTVNNTETAVGNQANLIIQGINNFESNITTQVNGIWQDVNNSNSTIHTQLNSIISEIDNVDSNITTQVNYIRQNINNSESNIITQVNSVWQTLNNTNSTIHTQINSVIQTIENEESNITTQITAVNQQINNFESNITTQINSVTASITNSETNITNQINLVNASINNANTSIITQINSVSTQITNHDTDIDTQLNGIQVSISNTETNLTNQINNIDIDISNMNTTVHNQLNTIITDISNSNSTIVNQANMIVTTITNTESNITDQLNTISTEIANSESNLTTQINLVNIEITNANNTIHTQLNGIFTSIINSESNITSQLNSISISIANTETNLTNQINSVDIHITNVNTSIQNQLNVISSEITNTETNIVNQVNLIWNTINNTNTSIHTQINGVHTTITTMWSNINYSFNYVIANISMTEVNITNLITDMNATLLAELVNVLDNVSEAGVSVFEKVEETLTNLNNVNTSLFSEIQSQALNVMINITEQTNINLNSLTNLSDAIGILVSGNLSTMIQNIYDNVSIILSDVNNLTINITGNLSVDLTQVLANLSSILENLSLTNVSIGNLINVTIGDLNDVVFQMWGDQNTSFGTLENRSIVVFNFYNTNQGLGLDRETLRIYVNDSRLIDNLYYCDNNTKINLTVKDYYNFTLYQNDFTISAPFTFIDLGLTFHSWLFGNKNNDYYMISLLKYGGSRWWERGIVPYGEREFMIPSGNYTLRIYDKDWDEIYNSSGNISVVNSRVYVIHGTNLTEIISGQSVIRGQLLELSDDLDYALMPDIEVVSYNPPMIFSIYDKEGMAIGGNIYQICPALITIATTRVETTGNYINSTARIPGNDTVTNGTIVILEDILYISGSGTTGYINITFTDNGTLMQNTTYIPSKINLYGQNITIRASNNIHILRETKYNQVKKFYWTYDASTGEHVAGIDIINPMDIPIYDVYVYVEFSNKSTADPNTVIMKDISNSGVVLKRGEHYDISLSGIHFYLLSINADTTRGFTIEYTKRFDDAYRYGEETINIPGYIETSWNGLSFNTFDISWINEKDTIFRGALYGKIDFKAEIDSSSVRVWDDDNNCELDESDFLFGNGFLRIDANGIGDVNPGGGRSFSVYFLLTEYPGVDPKDIHLNTPLFTYGGFAITPFLFIFLIGLILIGYSVYAYIYKQKKWKICRNGIVLGVFIIFIFYILAFMGV